MAIECKGRIMPLMFDFKGNAQVSFMVGKEWAEQVKISFDDIKDRDLRIEYKIWREKRSTDANAYAWHLITEIAKKIGSNKDDVYLELLSRYGVTTRVPAKRYVDAERFFKYYKIIEDDKSKDYIIYLAIAGSSTYDTKEMSDFINGIIEEAHELGISTLTPDEQANLISLWETDRHKYEKHNSN